MIAIKSRSDYENCFISLKLNWIKKVAKKPLTAGLWTCKWLLQCKKSFLCIHSNMITHTHDIPDDKESNVKCKTALLMCHLFNTIYLSTNQQLNADFRVWARGGAGTTMNEQTGINCFVVTFCTIKGRGKHWSYFIWSAAIQCAKLFYYYFSVWVGVCDIRI